MTETKAPYPNPFLWVPSSYLAMGLIYVTVAGLRTSCSRTWAWITPTPRSGRAFWGFPTRSSSCGRRCSNFIGQEVFRPYAVPAGAAMVAGGAFALRLPGDKLAGAGPGALGVSRLPPCDAGHRFRRRLCHHTSPEGHGEVHGGSRACAGTRVSARRRAADSFQRRAARAHK